MARDDFRIVEAGDSMLLVEFEERVDPVVNSKVVALADRLQAAPISGVLDVVPTIRSVAVYFDPLRTDMAALRARIEHDARLESSMTEALTALHVIPVRYGGTSGPDLADVASACRMTEDEVVARHTELTYRVFMLGFLPGFAYMAELDPRLVLPRRTTPRARVPRGSVAIAGAQTGIYSIDSPGGWLIIGQTEAKPFDLERAEPFLFRAGDRVRFERI